MILVNTDFVSGKEIVEVHGLVKGSTIRAKHIGTDIVAGLRNLVGGELKEYTEMFDEARQHAVNKMVKDAEKLGANGIINIRFASSMVAQGAAEILAYGTAVTLK